MVLRIFKSILTNFLSMLLAFSLCSPAIAAPKVNIFEREKQNINSLSEFIYGDEVVDKLSPVYLLGSVRKPGLYHIPPHTSLTTLLTIAGGPTEDSDIEDITIRNEESQRLDKLNFKNIIADKSLKSPSLYPRDVILVGTREPAISNNTVVAITVLSMLAAIVVSGIVIKKSL